MDSTQKKITTPMVWKKEWDMGVSDHDLVKMYDEVMMIQDDQGQPGMGAHNKETFNCDQEEATFEALLDEVLDL